MREGWCGGDYWMLCEDQREAEHFTALYGLGDRIPGYFIIGLKGWDEFILTNRDSQYFLVPTVPLEREALTPFLFPGEPLRLEQDVRFMNKIKWYVKPLRFGGDASANENIAWLSLEQHVQVVRWWSKFYDDTFKKKT